MTAEKLIQECDRIIRMQTTKLTQERGNLPIDKMTTDEAYARGQLDAAWALKQTIIEGTRPQPEGQKEIKP